MVLSSIFLASTLVHIIEREFFYAAAWLCVAACLSFVGAVHAFEVTEDGVGSAFGFPARGQASEERAARALAALLGPLRARRAGGLNALRPRP